MDSFPVPFTDDQIEVDPHQGTVSLFRNAWNRQSCGEPDQSWTFAELRQDSETLAALLDALAASDAAELERQIRG